MKLIDKYATLDYLNASEPHQLESWCQENGYHGVYPTRDVAKIGHDMPSDYILAAALSYAKNKYPDADNLDVCSYAGLVAYLATGWYGGFGTEEYEKERQAEHIVVALAGGVGGDGIYLMPESAVKGESATMDFTQQILNFLSQFYFEDKQKAVINLLDAVEDQVAAKLILSLTTVQDEYRAIAHIANEFLRKKATPKELREAVRAVIPKIAPQKVEPRKQTKLD
jgi:NAD kinase